MLIRVVYTQVRDQLLRGPTDHETAQRDLIDAVEFYAKERKDVRVNRDLGIEFVCEEFKKFRSVLRNKSVGQAVLQNMTTRCGYIRIARETLGNVKFIEQRYGSLEEGETLIG